MSDAGALAQSDPAIRRLPHATAESVRRILPAFLCGMQQAQLMQGAHIVGFSLQHFTNEPLRRLDISRLVGAGDSVNYPSHIVVVSDF